MLFMLRSSLLKTTVVYYEDPLLSWWEVSSAKNQQGNSVSSTVEDGVNGHTTAVILLYTQRLLGNDTKKNANETPAFYITSISLSIPCTDKWWCALQDLHWHLKTLSQSWLTFDSLLCYNNWRDRSRSGLSPICSHWRGWLFMLHAYNYFIDFYHWALMNLPVTWKSFSHYHYASSPGLPPWMKYIYSNTYSISSLTATSKNLISRNCSRSFWA